jgi:hypothetical protein
MDQFERYPKNKSLKDGWIENLIARLLTLVNGADRKFQFCSPKDHLGWRSFRFSAISGFGAKAKSRLNQVMSGF